MSKGRQAQWAKLAGYIVGYQATWIPTSASRPACSAGGLVLVGACSTPI